MSLIDQAATPNAHKLRMSETAGTKKGPDMLIQSSELVSLLRGLMYLMMQEHSYITEEKYTQPSQEVTLGDRILGHFMILN